MPDTPSLETETISKAEHDALVSEFRKENLCLQRVIAQNRVAHESELNRVLAEKEEEIRKIEGRNPLINVTLQQSDGVTKPLK